MRRTRSEQSLRWGVAEGVELPERSAFDVSFQSAISNQQSALSELAYASFA